MKKKIFSKTFKKNEMEYKVLKYNNISKQWLFDGDYCQVPNWNIMTL